MTARATDIDVLVVGAGPTGLALGCQLARFGLRFRIIDKQADRAHESRALAVQARSLEVLQAVGLGEALAARGRSSTRLMLHVDRRSPVAVDLGDAGRSDTRFPFILFVSQAETEAVLGDHLRAQEISVERGVELTSFHADEAGVLCHLRHPAGPVEQVRAAYVAGCDGAHSAVRRGAGIPFEGGAYEQTFALGDVEADGALVPGSINVFALGPGVAMFFPLGHPTTWRVMAMEGAAPRRSPADARGDISTAPLSLSELQGMVNAPTSEAVILRDPAWLTRFRLHHRQAARYRQGRLFLAGDAAHIHSPVGAQGMNTGIQDAWNLGWKLAMVARGLAHDRLLESYHAERWPVGRKLLHATDRLFGIFARAASGGHLVQSVRRAMVRGVVGPALGRPRVRAVAFHFVSQLGVRYRRSPAVEEGAPRLDRGPKAGDRLPDAPIRRAQQPTHLQHELSGPRLHLLLCGPTNAWTVEAVERLAREFADVVQVVHLTSEDEATALVDVDGEVLRALGVDNAAQYLIRPDGHVAFRCAGSALDGATEYLRRWFISTARD